MTESQRYYQNNLNMFSNGISLLSVSAIEVKNNTKVIQGQLDVIDNKTTDMQKHSSFLVDLSKKLKSRVREMEKRVKLKK